MFKPILAATTLALFLPSCDSTNADEKPGDKSSTAIIQILPSSPVLTNTAPSTENYMANEIASLSMSQTAKVAAEKAQMHPSEIQAALSVERIAGTDMARITAHSDDPAKAKKIVEATIEAYMSARKAVETNQARKYLDALDEEIISQSDKVQDHRKDLTILIQQYGIPYFEGTESPVGKTEIEMFATSRNQLMNLEIEALLLTAKFQALEGNPAERDKLAPQIKVINFQKEALSEYVNDTQGDTIDLSLKQHTYTQTKQAYLQARDLLREMKAHQQESRLKLKMPRSPIFLRQGAQ